MIAMETTYIVLEKYHVGKCDVHRNKNGATTPSDHTVQKVIDPGNPPEAHFSKPPNATIILFAFRYASKEHCRNFVNPIPGKINIYSYQFKSNISKIKQLFSVHISDYYSMITKYGTGIVADASANRSIKIIHKCRPTKMKATMTNTGR